MVMVPVIVRVRGDGAKDGKSNGRGDGDCDGLSAVQFTTANTLLLGSDKTRGRDRDGDGNDQSREHARTGDC